MRITAERKTLTAALKTALPAIPRSTSISALTGIRMIADTAANTLQITASSLDLTITHTCEDLVGSTTDADGTAVVAGAQLARLVGSMAGPNVELEADGTTMTVRSGAATATLHLVPVDTYPDVPTPADDTDWKTLDADTLHAISRVIHAASSDQSRPMLTGIAIGGQMVRATDSFRLAQHPIRDLPDAVIDAGMMGRCLGAADGAEIRVAFDDPHIHFGVGDTTWTTRPLADVNGASEYPSFGRLIRDGSPHEVTVPTEALRGALDRASTFSGAAVGFHPTVLRWGDGECRVECADPDRGSIVETVECDATGDVPDVAVRAEYLIDVCDHAEADELTIGIESEPKPLVVRSGAWLGLVMPVRQ